MADGSSGRCTGSTKRAANLSSSERQLLTELAMTRADVIENKRTDGATTREKEAAWVALAAEFNAASTVRREHRQLKQVISIIVNKWCRFGLNAAVQHGRVMVSVMVRARFQG